MDAKTPLLDKVIPNKQYLTPEMTPIHRYNIAIDCYNLPCNIVDSIELQKIPQSQAYQFIYRISTHLRGKILFIILCILPFVNILVFFVTVFFAYIYWSSLNIHQRNQAKVKDPFKKMTFDPQLCLNMGCDYYFFTIQLKCKSSLKQNWKDFHQIINRMSVKDQIQENKEEKQILWFIMPIFGHLTTTFINGKFIIIHPQLLVQLWLLSLILFASYLYYDFFITFIKQYLVKFLSESFRSKFFLSKTNRFFINTFIKLKNFGSNGCLQNQQLCNSTMQKQLSQQIFNVILNFVRDLIQIFFASLYAYKFSYVFILTNNKISYSMNKSLTLVVMAALIAGAVYFTTETSRDTAFDEWKSKYGANWAPAEQDFRRIVFQKNIAIINKHNADSTQTYKMGINQFTAMTEQEFVNTYLDPKPEVAAPVEDIKEPNADIDWTTKGGVSKVKNQGQCGSCWAFSATGVAESWALLKGQSVDLSEQQLVDCSGSYGNHGCNGGWPSSALNYVKDHGLSTQTEYPYTAVTGTCKKTGGNFHISSVLSASGCNGLQNAIQGRPVSVTVDATNWSKYASGIFSNCATSINHAVLLVGIVGGNWKIKNSWGTGWGQSGFIRLAGVANTCGVCAYAGVYPN